DAAPRVFDAVLHIDEESHANGMTLAEALKRTEGSMKVTQIQRGEGMFVIRLPTVKLVAGDRLYVSDSRENLKRYEGLLGAKMHNVMDAEHEVSEEHPLSAEGQRLAEVVVTEGSLLHRRTLRQLRFAEQYSVVILALHRASGPTPGKRDLGDTVLRTGDVLLLQGSGDSINELKERAGMLVLDGTIDLPHTKKAPVALAIFFAMVAAAGTGLAPISVASLIATGLVLLTGCLTWRASARR
ncbi:MAG: SLC13 family permease, partial [Gammaproteobacteria bacterium]|nr:SLC13 family permease [Gammaproteobacteria bacterium]